MAAEHHQPLRIYSQCSNDLDVTATKAEDGKSLVLHIANIQNQPVTTDICLNGFTPVGKPEITVLSAALDDRNTPEQPEKIIPVKIDSKDGQYCFPAHSYTIIKYTR